MNRQQRAAQHLLRTSRLRVELDDFWREDGAGGVDWGRLRDDKAFSTSEAALIDLAEDLVERALSRASCLDDWNFACLVEAIHIACGRDAPRPRPQLRAA